MKLPAPLRRGTVWMALQAGVVFAFHAASPGFELILRNDSRLYVKLARHVPTAAILESIRTLGYPLFLRGVDRLCPGFDCLPHLQLALYALAAVGLCAALEAFGLSSWAAPAAATPLLYSPLVPYMAPSAMTDLPGASLALATLALLLALVAASARRSAGALWSTRTLWGALGLCLFLTYQVRPAYVFLVVLVPAAGLLLPVLVGGWSWRRAARKWLVGLAAWSLIPFLLFCTVRWVAVGHFGLVSFTGYNLVGIAASMLDPELIAELPEEERGLARRILAHRRLRELEPVDAGSPLAAWWEPFIVNSWRIAIPTTRRLWREEYHDDAAASLPVPSRDLYVDRRLSRLSLAVIRARPGLYLVWLGRAWGFALWKTVSNPWIWAPAAAALLGLAVRHRRGRKMAGLPSSGSELRRSLGFLAVAAGFYLLSLGLTLLVEPPEWRYLATTRLLLPGALAAVAVELWRRLLPAVPSRR